MCYAGCRYELSWGENAGECSLPSGEKPPIDAMCVINDLGAENSMLRELAKNMYKIMDVSCQFGHAIPAGTMAHIKNRVIGLGVEVDE